MRQVVRWNQGNRTVNVVAPTKFGKDRADEIFNDAIKNTKYGPWSDRLPDQMSLGEIAYVHSVWDTLSGSSSFITAFEIIRQQWYRL